MNKDLIGDFAWGGGILVLALVASFARKQGYIDHDTTLRLVLGASGLMIAWTGNRLPKTFVPSARGREARRVAAWSLVLSGLVYAGLWAFAPFPMAVAGGSGAVLAGIAVTFGYCLSLRDKAKAG
ncbi:ammonium transporter [Caulobacter sp. ErkDOM-YI]|uniref:ammonium transporter n=1 Tax=unclassified Caulobacter TaxID=2648921 RepID=UPI003AF66153